MNKIATIAMTGVVASATILGGAPSASARVYPGAASGALHDEPFHYAKGDHLKSGSTPSTSSYGGSGRTVYLVGDSMAGQLSDGILRSSRARNREFKPRTRSATSFRLPANTNTAAGLWASRVFSQIKSDARAGEKPIVVLAGQNMGDSNQIARTVYILRKAGASVRLATGTPYPSNASSIPQCVARHPYKTAANKYCRWTRGKKTSGRYATLVAANKTNSRAIDMDRRVAIGKDGTHPSVRQGVSGRNIQIFRGAGSHITASASRDVFYPALDALVR